MSDVSVITAIDCSWDSAWDGWILRQIKEFSLFASKRGATWSWTLAFKEPFVGVDVLDDAIRAAELGGGVLRLLAGSEECPLEHQAATSAEDRPLFLVSAGTFVPHRTLESLLEAWTGQPLAARDLPGSAESQPKCVLLRPGDLEGFSKARVVDRVELSAVSWTDPTGLDPLSKVTERTLHPWATEADGGPQSVTFIIRTQGRREGTFSDALLSLETQLDRRFDVVIVRHDAAAFDVANHVGSLPNWLLEKIHVVDASGGTRSRPLNVGLSVARGDVVVFLDDDDLALPNLVKDVLEAGAYAPRCVLRSRVSVQRVAHLDGYAIPSDAPIDGYPHTYSLPDHLRVNMTPFMGFAFPRPLLLELGGADEELIVCEDWDLGLRAAVAAGVVDTLSVVAVYRRWTDGGDSYTLHDSQEWQKAAELVQSKFTRSFLVLAPGSARELIELSSLRVAPPTVLPAGLRWWMSWPWVALRRRLTRLLRTNRKVGGYEVNDVEQIERGVS